METTGTDTIGTELVRLLQTYTPSNTTEIAGMVEGIETILATALAEMAPMQPDPGSQDAQPTGHMQTTRIDDAIRLVDQAISAQIDAIMHHPEFQRMESAWRGLRYLVGHCHLGDNVRVSVMSATKDELLYDLTNDGVVRSGFLEHLYTAELGVHGGEPYGAVVANFEIGSSARDQSLLKNIAAVASIAHAPVLAAADPSLLGLDGDITTLPSHTEGILNSIDGKHARLKAWKSFRRDKDARYVGLTMPRMMLRYPYGPHTKATRSFVYTERAAKNHADYLWGNANFALAANIARSFAATRWPSEIIGARSGGTVENLPVYTYRDRGLDRETCPTEINLNYNQEFTLAELGLIGLTMKKNTNQAVFFSAQSAFLAEDAGMDAESIRRVTDHRLNAALPYTLIVTRIAHYLKRIMYECVGSYKNRADLEAYVTTWIMGFVSASEGLPDRVRSERPLKQAKVVVEDWHGRPGFYRFTLDIVPHVKFQGADIALQLVGGIDQKGQAG